MSATADETIIADLHRMYLAHAEDSDDLRLAGSAEELIQALAKLAGLKLKEFSTDDGPYLIDALNALTRAQTSP